MELRVFVPLLCCVSLSLLLSTDCSLPDITRVPCPLQEQGEGGVTSGSKVIRPVMNSDVARLPGLCRRLKRRRLTVLCNLEKFCWWGHSQGQDKGRSLKNLAGQVCRCPRGSRCPQFFVHSH